MRLTGDWRFEIKMEIPVEFIVMYLKCKSRMIIAFTHLYVYLFI